MAEERKRSIVFLVTVLVPALAGIILGYYIWGAGRHEQVDYKQVLQETINYISSMEQKNASLTSEVGKLESEVNALKQKGQEQGGKEETIATLSGRIQSLEAENQRLKDTIQRIEAFAQGDPVLKERIQGIIQQGSTGTAAGSPSQGNAPRGDGTAQGVR